MADPMDVQTAAHPPIGTARGLALALFRLVALAFALLGLWVMWQARDLVYYTPVGPGPGFFPMWLGGVLGLLSLAILGASLLGRSPALPERILPERTPAIQMGVTFAAIAFFALAVERAGFVITMFLVLIVLMLMNRVRPLTALLVALGGSVGVAWVFVQWLGVFLPTTPFGLLSAIGL
ncbi:tripartite tricarboxylate transporter TctB family protein [Ancylobacter sp. Lp-2]|uniref:tripartite tricarboxylate transporter TctB family protein n=1 Tax=Ancylobacter sp. Lp-2 TaxID=2881339 RepID=UPI001E517919|nr:tripartite tricarboxylate transporter TctB family protein [Ancylobacter sp. Lp-2]MCB4771584.1 tripartite tricarboxylate transporter TctB family protein [Ancylobacter sp. Lp-2]